ncbi:DUF488 family protein [Isoptericola sp. NPDC057391]|uniref:DUF488 domain-containing protein n=1 Tax=Isoptericola sp. NPDC057391 TaxID=3346117 RepID=UPI003635FA65
MTGDRPSAPFFTVGHSNRALAEFVDLLHGSGIELVVDVRRLPGSARYPWFDEDALRRSLRAEGIDLHRAAGLAGRRPASRDVPPEVNGWWENRSFHHYADHALSDEFRRALSELREQGRTRRLAVMCAEAVWWRCHRRIVADHLLARGEAVRHVLAQGRVEDARLSAGAVVGAGGEVTYPASGP